MEDSQVVAALSAQLAERIGRKRFDLWFTSQAQLSVCGHTLSIRAGSMFVVDWLRAYFADEIQASWEAVVGSAGTVKFNVADISQALTPAPRPKRGGRVKPLPTAETAEGPSFAATGKNIQGATTSTAPAAASARPAALREQRRMQGLAGFIMGPSNEYAFRAAELSASGRQQATPLVFCGPTGVGKTHLLRAVQQEFRRQHPRQLAVYMTAEQFTTGYVEAVRGSGLPSFRQKCRGAELLVIDDLQFFVGKRRTIEELLYTLDTVSGEGRQILLSSDRGLGELRGLGPELISRLSGGLICEIGLPEFATRRGIVRQMAEEAHVELTEDVVDLLAMQITAGARELRGAIYRLKAMSVATKEPVSRPLVEQAIAELARQNSRSVRLADVQKVICDAFGIEPAVLRSDRKQRSVAEPRMVAMWLARKYTRAPWSEIGQYFGRASHSTVISAHKRFEKLIAKQGQIGMANQPYPVDEAIRRLETALRTA